jgi:hypothetical protein
MVETFINCSKFINSYTQLYPQLKIMMAEFKRYDGQVFGLRRCDAPGFN